MALGDQAEAEGVHVQGGFDGCNEVLMAVFGLHGGVGVGGVVSGLERMLSGV